MKQDRPAAGELPAKEQRPKQFDTRLLDRIEVMCSQYRHWHGDKVADYPHGYIESQKEAYRMELRNAAQALADALRDQA